MRKNAKRQLTLKDRDVGQKKAKGIKAGADGSVRFVHDSITISTWNAKASKGAAGITDGTSNTIML